MRKLLPILLCCLLPLAGRTALGQTDLPHFGIALTASTLGAGIQAATAVTAHSNVRAGFNIFDYSHNFSKDGVNYEGELRLRSVQVTYDQFFGTFHISPGLLIYNGNKGSATASVSNGQTFTLGGVTYYSSQTNPVTGSGTLTVNKAAPMILFGFGNLLPRTQRHLGVNFEAGVVFEGTPKAKLNLTGAACITAQQVGCVSAATDPVVLTNVQSEQNKLNDSIGPFKFYPVISLGFSYKF
ncbi:MAG: hypothetical protein M3N54_15520 [Acidobacteriota bacterium]|nr:hypothetical protein [Acidobacteriota bacterium]